SGSWSRPRRAGHGMRAPDRDEPGRAGVHERRVGRKDRWQSTSSRSNRRVGSNVMLRPTTDERRRGFPAMPRNRPFPPPWRAATLLAVLACPALVAQEPWSTEDLRARSEGFHAEGVLARYRQIGELVQHRDVAFDALCASIHGDHREYQLKIERLLDQLSEERWLAREDAERTLIEVGGRAIAQIEQRSLEG